MYVHSFRLLVHFYSKKKMVLLVMGGTRHDKYPPGNGTRKEEAPTF